MTPISFSLLTGPSGFYILENLQPTTTYDLRFASKNLVGFSEWGAGKQLTMPQRGPPEKPRINTVVCLFFTKYCRNIGKEFVYLALADPQKFFKQRLIKKEEQISYLKIYSVYFGEVSAM